MPSEIVLTIGWNSLRHMELEPAHCGDENCEADHGYTGTVSGDDITVRLSADAEGEGAVRAALDAAGEVVARQVTRAQEADGLTDARVLYRTTLLGANRLKPRETTTLAVEVADAAARPIEQLGDYRIVREVGRGGMGVVYEARQTRLRRAALYEAVKDYARAEKELTVALQLAPPTAELFATRGYFYMRRGRIPDALNDFLAGVRLAPDNARLRFAAAPVAPTSTVAPVNPDLAKAATQG